MNSHPPETLRQQFQQLQDQHQKKLLLRKQRLSGTKQETEVHGNEEDHSTTKSVSGFLGGGIEDNLELKVRFDCFLEDHPLLIHLIMK